MHELNELNRNKLNERPDKNLSSLRYDKNPSIVTKSYLSFFYSL